jgi:endoglucanase
LPALHVQGNRIVDETGNTVVLRGVAVPDIGVLFSDGGGISGVTGRIDEILGAAALDIHAIRLPVYPRTVVNDGNPTYSPLPYPVGPAAPLEAGAVMELSASDYIAQVLQPAVDYATSKNLYAIVDYHQIDNVTTGTSSADAVTFWTTVAPVFAGYSNVVYEAFNEPIDSTGNAGITAAGAWTSAFTTAAQSWISAIRAGAPNNVIIVGSPSWSQYPDGALTAGLTGGNLVFTAHAYPSNWPGTGFQSRVAKAAMGEPVAMTEWGYSIGTMTPNDTWAQNLQTFVNSGGESWTAWVADPYWGPPMFTRPTTSTFNSFNGLNDFGTFVQNWLAAASGSSDGGTEQ